MAQQQKRPFVADPNEWEVIDEGGDLEAVEETPAPEARTWSDELGLNEPTDSRLKGFARGAGGAVVDMWQGAASGLANRVQSALQGDNAAIDQVRQMRGQPVDPSLHRSLPAALMTEAPPTMAGKIGTLAPTVAEMAVPSGAAVKGGKAAINALPSAARAGEKFQDVMGAAKNIPIDVKDVGDAALRISELAERGGSMPMAVRKILNRMTDPNKPALNYQEARDFASNISRLSADEMRRLTPVVRREVAQLSAALNKANAEAAKAAGKGAEYKSAMREYAKAMQLKDALDKALKHSKKAALGAAGLGGAYWMFKD